MREWYHDRSGEDTQVKDRWLITYADLITLLMVFFIVMWALSARVSPEKFDQLASSLQQSLKKAGDKSHAVTTDSTETKKLKQIATSAAAAIEETDPKAPVAVRVNERGLVLSLVDTAFFAPGSATLKPQSHKVLLKMAASLKGLPNDVRVEGHTDNVPIHTSHFPSNWELSASRAAAVARFLVERAHLPAARFSAAGFAEHRPVADNRSAGGRNRNRRVEIVVVRVDPPAGPAAAPAAQATPPAAPEVPAAPARRNAPGFVNPFQ